MYNTEHWKQSCSSPNTAKAKITPRNISWPATSFFLREFASSCVMAAKCSIRTLKAGQEAYVKVPKNTKKGQKYILKWHVIISNQESVVHVFRCFFSIPIYGASVKLLMMAVIKVTYLLKLNTVLNKIRRVFKKTDFNRFVFFWFIKPLNLPNSTL